MKQIEHMQHIMQKLLSMFIVLSVMLMNNVATSAVMDQTNPAPCKLTKSHGSFYSRPQQVNQSEEIYQPRNRYLDPEPFWQNAMYATADFALDIFRNTVSPIYHREHRTFQNQAHYDGFLCRAEFNGHGVIGRTDGYGHCVVAMLYDVTVPFKQYRVLHR